MITNKELIALLLNYKISTEKRLEELSSQTEKEKGSFYSKLITENIISSDHLVKLVTEFLGIPRVYLMEKKIDSEVLTKLPEKDARSLSAVCFQKTENKFDVAVADPQKEGLEGHLRKAFGGEKFNVFLATPREIEDKLLHYKKDLGTTFKDLIVKSTKIADRKVLSEAPIINIIDTILEYALAEQASDVHIEPRKEYVLVRYRVDGILQEVIRLDKDLHTALIARLKVISKLRIDEVRAPQDGRFNMDFDKNKLTCRISIMPSMYGEKAAIRILKESVRISTLEDLGFTGPSFERVQESITKTSGILLATGPTGSGKTSTLYSILRMLDSTSLNISTIEDPIEYEIPMVNQFQVNKDVGLTFATGLRSLLRQDPDVLMVGEIRDSETASIAMNAALTGHFVLSTLHTTDAAGVLPRLSDMGIEPYIVASTVSTVIAQRLVRRNCPHCIASYKPSKQSLRNIEEMTSKEYVKTLPSVFYHGSGCEACNGSGYMGRVGLFEVLSVSEKIQSLIDEKASSEEIHKQALKEGMIPMVKDGIEKAEKGITSIEEIIRVLKD